MGQAEVCHRSCCHQQDRQRHVPHKAPNQQSPAQQLPFPGREKEQPARASSSCSPACSSGSERATGRSPDPLAGAPDTERARVAKACREEQGWWPTAPGQSGPRPLLCSQNEVRGRTRPRSPGGLPGGSRSRRAWTRRAEPRLLNPMFHRAGWSYEERRNSICRKPVLFTTLPTAGPLQTLRGSGLSRATVLPAEPSAVQPPAPTIPTFLLLPCPGPPPSSSPSCEDTSHQRVSQGRGPGPSCCVTLQTLSGGPQGSPACTGRRGPRRKAMCQGPGRPTPAP